MAELPNTMRSLVAPKPCKPEFYEVRDLPLPTITRPDEMLIKVHAASLQTGDTQIAAGMMSLIIKTEFPTKLSIECSGTVVSTGSEVRNFRPGDAVYGVAFGRPMEFDRPPGYCSEYCVGREIFFVPKPPHISFEEAAGILGITLTAHESLELGEKHMAAHGKKLEGSTVFVPAALSSTSPPAIQLLKNVFGAKRIVTTVSTAKIPQVEEYFPGLVDQVVDYQTTPKLTEAVPAGSIDFAYNTQFGSLVPLVPLMNRDTGVIVSIASVFPSRLFKLVMGPSFPIWAGWLADLVGLYYRWLLRGTNIEMDFVSGNAEDRDRVEKVSEIIALQKVRSVMRVVKLEDIDALRAACNQVYNGKGGLGKLVVKIV
ncbi:putative Alcohol dehydrogenase [Seiridium cardinale]|uniref:Alcohol dehydrogenase n=1 Tax=Seiridium cardinale TaxID=138064 RepID=A0ABR2XUH9_9PEZI